MTSDKSGWRLFRVLFRERPYYIWAPKGSGAPDWVELKKCEKCGKAHYSHIRYLLVGEWVGEFDGVTSQWLNKIMKGRAEQ